MGDVSCRCLGSGSAVLLLQWGVSTPPFLQLIVFVQLFAFAPGPVEHGENRLVQPHTCASSIFRRVIAILFGIDFAISAHELFLLMCQRTCQTEEIQLFLFSLFQTNLRDDVDNVFPVHVVK